MDITTAKELPTYYRFMKKAYNSVFYTSQKFEKDIEVDVASQNPIQFLLNCDTPSMSIWFRITNMSPYLAAAVDQIVISLWLRSADNWETKLLDRHPWRERTTIGRRGSEKIHRSLSLSEQQLKNIGRFIRQPGVVAIISIDVDITSRFYSTEKQAHLERVLCMVG